MSGRGRSGTRPPFGKFRAGATQEAETGVRFGTVLRGLRGGSPRTEAGRRRRLHGRRAGRGRRPHSASSGQVLRKKQGRRCGSTRSFGDFGAAHHEGGGARRGRGRLAAGLYGRRTSHRRGRPGFDGCAEDGRVSDAAPAQDVETGCGSTRPCGGLRGGSPRTGGPPRAEDGRVGDPPLRKTRGRRGVGVATCGDGCERARGPGCTQPGPQGTGPPRSG